MKWKVKKFRLGNISKISYGYTTKASFEKTEYHFLRITDIQDNTVNWESVPFCSLSASDYDKYQLIDDDIVFARTGATTGKSYLVKNPPKTVAASYLIRLRLDDKNILPEFLIQYFQTSEYWSEISSGISGSAQGGFNASKLAELVIPVPPLEEQKRIVEILDESFEAIALAEANTKKNLANARELFDSYLNKIFTDVADHWTQKHLGDVCKFQGGSQPPKSEFSSTPKEGYIRLIQIRDYKTDKRQVFIPKDKAKRFCSIEDIMIGRYGPPLFQILKGLEGAYNVALMKAVPNEKVISKDFLFYFLKNKKILRYIEKSSSRTAGQTGFNKATIEPYPIVFPSLNEQSEVVEKLQQVLNNSQKLEAIYQRKLEALAELKQSILQKAFTGQLTQ